MATSASLGDRKGAVTVETGTATEIAPMQAAEGLGTPGEMERILQTDRASTRYWCRSSGGSAYRPILETPPPREQKEAAAEETTEHQGGRFDCWCRDSLLLTIFGIDC